MSFDDLAARVKRMSSLMAAIEAGDLLAVLPEGPAARANHAVALDLLTLLQDELQALSARFEGGWGSA